MSKKQMTHSEKMAEMADTIDRIKGILDTLLKVKRDGNAKQVVFWVGKLSHDVGALGKLLVAEALAGRKKEIIT